MKPVHTRRTILVNTIGTLGYMSLIIQWAWTMITVVLPRIPEDFDWLFLFTDKSAPKPTPINFDIPDVITWSMAIVITIIILAITIVTIIRLPKTIGKQGARITHATATRALPIVTRHKKVTKKERAKLSFRIIIVLKFGATLLALALLIFAKPTEQMTREMVVIVGALCALLTIFYFGIQVVLAHLLHIKRETVW